MRGVSVHDCSSPKVSNRKISGPVRICSSDGSAGESLQAYRAAAAARVRPNNPIVRRREASRGMARSSGSGAARGERGVRGTGEVAHNGKIVIISQVFYCLIATTGRRVSPGADRGYGPAGAARAAILRRRRVMIHAILGANGVIGRQISMELSGRADGAGAVPRVRQVSRSPRRVNPTDEPVPADLLDPRAADDAVKGSDIAYLVAGLPYRTAVWREQWPRIMQNVIAACGRHRCRLVFFDNV